MCSTVDETLLLKCLKADELVAKNTEMTIRNYEICRDVAIVGSNYTSDIFRIWIEYESNGELRKKRLIFKVPSESNHYEFVAALGLYDTEVYMYEVILPEISRLLGFRVAPIHYCTIDSQNLILEDLCEIGYNVEPRELLSFEQGIATMRTLAQFHAASAKLYQEKRSLFVGMGKTILFAKPVVEGVIAACNPVLADVLHHEGVSDTSISKFLSYATEMSNKPLYRIANRTAEFNVFNHGNMKTNNILFTYDKNGLPTSAKIIDYQTSCFGSPAFDLVFLFNVSMSFSTYQRHFNRLLDTYLTTLNETLRRLDYEQEYLESHFERDLKGAKLFCIFCLIWTGFIGIRAAIKNFDYGKNYIPLAANQIQTIRTNQKFRDGFLAWFQYYESIDFF